MKAIPAWVKDLDDADPNKTIYLQLIEHGEKKLETPREAAFAIMNISNKEDAENIAYYAEQEKWIPEISFDDEDKTNYWVECTKKDYVISKDRVDEDEAYFTKLARLYDAEYDGWYASVE